MKPATSNDPRVIAAIVGFGVLAGAAFIFVKVLVGEITPLQVVAGRTVAGAIAVIAVMAATRAVVPRSMPFVRGSLVLAMLDGVVPYLLIAHAQVHVTSATSAILVATMPLFTTLFASMGVRRESTGPVAAFGLAAGFVGVGVLAGPDALDVTSSGTLGMAAILLAAVSYAAAAVYAKGVLRMASPIAVTGAKLTMSAVIVAPVALALDGTRELGSMSPEAVASLVILGFGSTGLARCVYLWAVGQAGSVKASLVTYIAPVVAIIMGWVLLGETAGAATLGGAALIVSGVASVMFGHRIESALRGVLASIPALGIRRAGAAAAGRAPVTLNE